MGDPSSNEEILRVIMVLEALKQASHELQAHPSSDLSNSNSSAVKALLELETESDTILSIDPHLSALSNHLAKLKSLVDSLQKTRGYSLRTFLTRRVSTHCISRVAGSIESELQAWIDRESVENLTAALKKEPLVWVGKEEEQLVSLLSQFEERVQHGFDRELQDLVLKTKVFWLVEQVVCDEKWSKRIREHCACVVDALIGFNKDVFVGQVVMGTLVRALVSMDSWKAMRVLCSLIISIKSPLVDEIVATEQIPKIIALLDYKELRLRLMAMDCILELGYFGRKEAIEGMLKEGLVKKLVELQRSDLGGDLIDMEKHDDDDNDTDDGGVSGGGDLIDVGKHNDDNDNDNGDGGVSGGGDDTDDGGVRGGGDEKPNSKGRDRFMEMRPFASCVARFAVQLEVGQGLRRSERRAFKQAILAKVREACASDAEAATILAEVLWGSSL